MITSVHFLLTYTCNFECDHCFLYCGPQSKGTFTLARLRNALDQIEALGTVESVYFEGGEPFLYYPLLSEGVRMARERGLGVGVVTNNYWAATEEDAALWLEPLARLTISDLSISDDRFHRGDSEPVTARAASGAAERLGIPVHVLSVDDLDGGLMIKGRAADTVSVEAPRRPWIELTSCPHEELTAPKRVHLDPFGYVHICQGLAMGNINERPLAALAAEYNAAEHPVCAPLVVGGPALLTEKYGIEHGEAYVDECHLCYLTRLALIDRFPGLLAPRQVYGLSP